MPHRKPLGTTCRTRCRWAHPETEPPELGHYLATRSGLFYRIVGVAETGRPDVFNLLLERVGEGVAREPGIVVHDFAWDSRRPQKSLA